ncbi:hypothetical protein F2Q69_00010965 [Brassica cretica]|uniref:Protein DETOXIFICATION n=1 Tax=Brassica cretica TaxID=69181 RepID=A0A8S9R5B7_BRACR|nr:hypothetical protein F2Q69_00010965 [Brassica cretica]
MQVGEEVASLTKIACPIVMTSLLIFSRSIISMWFLSHLGEVELAGGALAMGFGNITGVSVLKGLSVGLALRSLFRGWWPLLSLAAPSAISVCLEYWWYEIMLFLCGLLGNPKASVSAMGILIQTTGILYVVPFAISSAIATRVGHALGGGQPTRAQCTTVIGLILAVAYGLSAAAFVTALRSVWGKMFTDEPEILGLISSALPILGLCEIGNSPQTAACGVLTGTARPKDGVRVNLCAFYIVGLPVAVATTFGFKVGFCGLWYGLLTAQITCLVMMLCTLIRTDWTHQVKRAEELTSSATDRSHSEEEAIHIDDDVGSNDLEIGLLQ